jgi:hypothetical protein
MSQNKTQELLSRVLEKQQLLYDMLIEAYSYMPIVYTQQNVPTGTEKENVYIIKTHLDRLPDNGLLFVLPKYTSTTDTVKLKILFNNDITKAVTYTVYLENTNGNLIKASSNSLVANRLAIFRVIEQFSTKTTTDDAEVSHMVVLTNNPFYNNLAISQLNVSNQAIFRRMPIYLPDTHVDGTEISKGFEFVLYADYQDLLNRVATLERRLVVGTEDIEDVADTLEEGQIYMKVEDIEV